MAALETKVASRTLTAAARPAPSLTPWQGVPLEQLRFRRMLFGAFPCYPHSAPLAPAFDRVLQVGDAAASQSPLSFGGFGSLVRTGGVAERGGGGADIHAGTCCTILRWLGPLNRLQGASLGNGSSPSY